MRYALLALLLSGCALPGNDAIALKMLGNLEYCDRQYTLGVGAGAAGSMSISCRARPYDAPTAR